MHTTSFLPPSSHSFSNTTTHHHHRNTVVLWPMLDFIETSGVLMWFGIINRLLERPLRTTSLLLVEHNHVNSRHQGWVARLASTSSPVPSNCCTDTSAHSGFSPEPISPPPAATSGVGNILITRRWTPQDEPDNSRTLVFTQTFPVDHPEPTEAVLLFKMWHKHI